MEVIVGAEADAGPRCAAGIELPDHTQAAKRSIRRIDTDPPRRPIGQRAVGVAELQRRQADGHARYDLSAAGAGFAASENLLVRASRHELGVAFDVEDQGEHRLPVMLNGSAYDDRS